MKHQWGDTGWSSVKKPVIDLKASCDIYNTVKHGGNIAIRWPRMETANDPKQTPSVCFVTLVVTCRNSRTVYTIETNTSKCVERSHLRQLFFVFVEILGVALFSRAQAPQQIVVIWQIFSSQMRMRYNTNNYSCLIIFQNIMYVCNYVYWESTTRTTCNEIKAVRFKRRMRLQVSLLPPEGDILHQGTRHFLFFIFWFCLGVCFFTFNTRFSISKNDDSVHAQ